MVSRTFFLISLLLLGCASEPKGSKGELQNLSVDADRDHTDLDNTITCSDVAVSECEDAGCKVYDGYTWNEDMGCYETEQIAFCIPKSNCNNFQVVGTSEDGQQVFFLSECQLSGWQFSEQTGAQCE